MDIYLIRHTKPSIGPGICYGISDIELAQTFIEELDILKTKIHGINNLKIISSPLKRCSILAKELAYHVISTEQALLASGEIATKPQPCDPSTTLGVTGEGKFSVDNRLMEMDFGEWEMRSWPDIMDKSPDLYQKWESEYVNFPPPQGETFSQVYKRCSSLMDELINAENGDYALITHGGVIRALIAYVLNLPLENAFSLGVDPGSVTKLSINGLIKTVEYINR